MGLPTPTASRTLAANLPSFEEIYRALPINGSDNFPITWGESEVPETEEVLAARRSLAYSYWNDSETDGRKFIPVAQYLYTDNIYQTFFQPFLSIPDNGETDSGQIWVKTMGVESTGLSQATVTFCVDIGHLRSPQDAEPVTRKNRGILESRTMTYERAIDGELRWLTSGFLPTNYSPKVSQYGAECERWAQNTP